MNFKPNFPTHIEQNTLARVKLTFISSLIFAIYSYGLGYDLFIEFMSSVETKQSSVLLFSIESFQITRQIIYLLLLLWALHKKFHICGWAALSLFCLYEYSVASHLRPYSTNFIFFSFLFLLMSPKTGLFDSFYKNKTKLVDASPLIAIQVVIGILYLSAFITKMIKDPTGWLDSTNLQYALKENYLFRETQPVQWVLNHPVILFLCNYAMLIFEASFLLSLTGRWMALFYCLSGLIFHFSIYQIMDINFLHYLIPSYLCFTIWIYGKPLQQGIIK